MPVNEPAHTRCQPLYQLPFIKTIYRAVRDRLDFFKSKYVKETEQMMTSQLVNYGLRL